MKIADLQLKMLMGIDSELPIKVEGRSISTGVPCLMP